jgi:ABC-type glycerol-3-phosphate transport system substrate-binding protein
VKNIVFRLFLCALLIIFSLSACDVRSADAYHPNDSYTDSVVTKAGTFSGIFRIKTEASDSLTLDPDSSVSSVRADAMKARYEEVEKLFNCTIEARQVKTGNIASTMMASTAAARNYADIFQLSAASIYDMYKGGYLTYAQNLEEFDITDEKWGYDGQKDMMTFRQGETYGFRNLYWAAPLASVSGVLYYNSDILYQNVQPIPAELYEQGEWTWDAFSDICLAVTHFVSDRQGTFAFVTPTAEYPAIIHAAINSNGGRRLSYDPVTGYKCEYMNYNTIDALQWLGELVRNNRITYTIENSASERPEVEAFVNFYTAFLVSDSSVGFSDDEMFPMYTFAESFRWTEFPAGPDFSGKTTAYYSMNDQFLAISNTVDIGITGKILNALFEPLDKEDDNGWKEYVERNFFFYSEDYERYENMIKNAVSDDSLLTMKTNLSENDIFAAVIDGVKTPKEATEQLISVIEGLAG